MSTSSGNFVKGPDSLLPVVDHVATERLTEFIDSDPFFFRSPLFPNIGDNNPLLSGIVEDLSLDVTDGDHKQRLKHVLYATVAHGALEYQGVVDANVNASNTTLNAEGYHLPKLTPSVISPVYAQFEQESYSEKLHENMRSENPNLAYLAHRLAHKLGGQEDYNKSLFMTYAVHGLLRTQAAAERDTPVLVESDMPYPLPVVSGEAAHVVGDQINERGFDYYIQRFDAILRDNPDLTNYIGDFIEYSDSSDTKYLRGMISMAVTTMYDLLNVQQGQSAEGQEDTVDLQTAPVGTLDDEMQEIGVNEFSGLVRARIAYHNPVLDNFGRDLTLGVTETTLERRVMRGVFNLTHEAFYRQAMFDKSS